MKLNEVKVAVDSSLWVEKYKPTEIDNVLAENHLKEKFKQYIEKKDLPNLLFQGSAGNGKTTCARIIANAISDDILFINASSESGIDVVRHKIEPFCTTQSLGDGFKIVILDEMEMSSESFQTALREVIERTYRTTRFILTCNFINKVIEPLKSRTQEYKFGDIAKIDIFKRCVGILNAEEVKFSKNELIEIVKAFGTDMRRLINALQKLTIEIDGEKTLSKYTSLEERKIELLKLIKSRKLTDVRTYIIKHNMNADEVVKFLFNKAFEKEITVNNWTSVIATLAEVAFQLKVGVDQEISLINGILQIMNFIEE